MLRTITVYFSIGLGALLMPAQSHAANFQVLDQYPAGFQGGTTGPVSGAGTALVVNLKDTSGSLSGHVWTVDQGYVALSDVPDSEYEFVYATGISEDGTRVVGSVENPTYGAVGFQWTVDTGLEEYVFPESKDTRFTGVSADGTVISGYASDSYQDFPIVLDGDDVEALTFADGVRVYGRALNVSADGSTLVGAGYMGYNYDFTAFRWSHGMVEDLGGVDSVGSFGSSYAHACSDDGMIVVGISNFYFGKGQFAIPYSLGTIWEGGQAPESTGWISFSGHQSALNAVTADGMMAVGYNRSLTGISEAILWRYEGGIESLSSVLQTDYGIDLNGFKLAVATGISSDGTVIVGYGSYASEYDTPFRIDLKDSASPVEPPSASSRR